MRAGRGFLVCVLVACAWLVAAESRAQGLSDESRWVLDFAIGIDNSINGNVNSGAIGRLEGQATAVLPHTYGDVYGTGIQLRAGGGYLLNENSELRGVFIFQSADADLVRLGDLGPSSLYGEYSDYQSLSLDFGYRRYLPLTAKGWRIFGEGTMGIAFIDAIDVRLAAPQANVVFENTDFYDQTAAFTWSLSGGVLFRVAERVDLSAQLGLRRVSGLAEVDQFVGTGLEGINNDTARLTFPIVVGARFHF